MRTYAIVGAILSVLVNPNAVTLDTAVRTADANAADQAVETQITLNVNNQSALVVEAKKAPDFQADYVKPAKKLLDEQRKQRELQRSAHIKQALAAAGFKTDFAAQYLIAQDHTGTPWQLIAAVHKVETGQRGDTTVASYAGAQGPMQFMPPTWRAYGMDADGDGVANIYDIDDAILGGANYLAANGANRGDFTNALFRYNHSMAYVNHVLGLAYALGL